MTLLKYETLSLELSVKDQETTKRNIFGNVLGGDKPLSQEQDLPGQQQAQQTEDDITPLQELGQEVVENVATAQEKLIVEEAEDRKETKRVILQRLDTMIRGRELKLDEELLNVMISLSVGVGAAVGDNLAIFDKVPWLGIVPEYLSDQGLEWLANNFDKGVREVLSRVTSKDYRKDKPLIKGTANLISGGIGLGTKALVGLGFIPAGVVGDFTNPATVQAIMEMGKYTPVIGAFVERGVNATDTIIDGVTGVVRKVFGKTKQEGPKMSFMDWWDQKLHEGVTFSTV